MGRDFSKVERVVVKVGTNLLSSENGIDTARIERVVGDIIALRERGVQVLLVSSGAIGLGARELKRTSAVRQIALRQACASIGQPLLMSYYRSAFKKHDSICSQILLTRSDMNQRKTFVNLKNSIDTLLALGVVPIINENDVVSIAEIGTAFGDNDRLSAFVASKIDADLLIILTDIDGLYDKDPRLHSDAQLLNEVATIDETMLGYGGGTSGAFSTGGMRTKLLAAKIAAFAGCATVIASGYEEDVLQRIYQGESLGTLFHAKEGLKQRQRWIINTSPEGTIWIDEGAVAALRAHKSLLPSGVVAVEGVFHDGDVVMINKIAKAVPYYNSTEILKMAGRQGRDIPSSVRKGKSDVLFRPEDIVFLDNGE
ncbi:MAG: glutamate 5-kinase [Spirochaetales bacterium]|nr:glutamate 5-kinase [Spirochaetales bacterium]